MGTQEFYENGLLEKISSYSYEYSEHDGHDLKRTVETEYYEDGPLKIQRVIQELKDDIEKENFKEYYTNGFLKIESEIMALNKNGVYREYFENGNTKYEGIFKDDKPIDKQCFYNSKGEITKIETWKYGKIIKTMN
jgi:antitoxin component YwqK of YwqJK toxin-antitoxin module